MCYGLRMYPFADLPPDKVVVKLLFQGIEFLTVTPSHLRHYCNQRLTLPCNDPVHVSQVVLSLQSGGIIRFEEKDIRDDPTDVKVLRQLPGADICTTAGHGGGEPKVSPIDRLVRDLSESTPARSSKLRMGLQILAFHVF